MTYLIKDEALLQRIKTLGQQKRKGIIDVIRDAVDAEFQKEANKQGFLDCVSSIQQRVRVTGNQPIDWAEMKRHDDALGDI